MSCPDTERIIELAIAIAIDPEAELHVQHCAECRAELRLIAAAREAYSPAVSVPDALVERALSAVLSVANTNTVPAALAGSIVAPVTAAALGGLTVLLAVLGTGSLGGENFSLLVVLTLVSAGAAAIYERRLLVIPPP